MIELGLALDGSLHRALFLCTEPSGPKKNDTMPYRAASGQIRDYRHPFIFQQVFEAEP